MTNKYLQYSAKMAIPLGGLLPMAEIIRRANQLSDLRNFFTWFDDFLLGFVLVFAAIMALQFKENSKSYLIAGWGMAVGGHFLSCLRQFDYYYKPEGDPGIFSTTFVLIMKGVILIYMFIGLYFSIKASEDKTI